MDIRQQIRLEAESMRPGETKRLICPSCRGGSDEEDSLSITLFGSMVVKYNCFRSKCTGDVYGVLNLTKPVTNETQKDNDGLIHTPKEYKRPKRFDGRTTKLTSWEKEWIENHWRLEPPLHWYHTNEFGGRVAMSVRSPLYSHRGWVLRDIKGSETPKALMYVDDGEVPLCWYRNPKNEHACTVIVEDIPSAVKASQYVTNAVALLGTGIGPDRAVEIARWGHRPIILMLDNDATQHSFTYAEENNLLWGKTRIVPLRKDLKDMSPENVEDLICRSLP